MRRGVRSTPRRRPKGDAGDQRHFKGNGRSTHQQITRIMNTPPYFLPYQNRWINDTSRLKIMEKSRQIGISFCTAFSAVRRVAQQGARLDVWVSSRDEVQARLFLEDC